MNKNLIKGLIVGAALGVYGTGVYQNTQKLSKELEPVREEFRRIVKEEEPKIERDFSMSIGREKVTYDYGGKLEEIANTVKQFGKDNGAIYTGGWGVEKKPYDEEITTKSMRTPLTIMPWNWGSVNKSSLEHHLNKDTHQYK